MFKRFFDCDKWDKPWYRDLTPGEKCAWEYITSKCDNVGVWIPDYKGADFAIGENIDWDGFIAKCNGNIEIMANGKWWIVDFCRFQHKDLAEGSKSKPIMSYIELLKSHGLWELFNQKTIPLAYPMDTLSIGYGKGMDSLQGKGKGKGKGRGKGDDDLDDDELFEHVKSRHWYYFDQIGWNKTHYANNVNLKAARERFERYKDRGKQWFDDVLLAAFRLDFCREKIKYALQSILTDGTLRALEKNMAEISAERKQRELEKERDAADGGVG